MIFKKIKKSFRYALTGFRYFLKERNIKIHLCATIFVIALGLIFCISAFEWIAIIISIVLVISLEIINTVIEDLINFLHPHKEQKVMIIKDLAAAAVFVSAMGSIIVGLIIFFPYVIDMFGRFK